MARLALALVAILPHGLLCLDPFALTSKQKSELQIAATTAVLPSESTCPGMNEEPTDTEKDFATNPYWKYFTYDTFDSHSWVTLNNLEECMRRVKGGGSNDWVGADDLWEAHKLIYQQFGDTARPTMWWKQGWIEYSPVKNSATVLGLAKEATAPMSSMSEEAWEQQPCNAFSNAAFFEVSLAACQAEDEGNFVDYSGTWSWRDEVIAAGALMAYGSFAMHGNPSSGQYHEGIISDDPNASTDMGYDTAMFDRVSMDVLFFVFYHSIVRAMAIDPTDEASLKPILGLIKNEQLAPLGCDNMYCDSRLIVREYQRILTGPTENWHVIHDMRNMVPDYKTASVGLVLVSIRAILSDELFGSSSMNAYSQICGILIGSLLPGDGTSVIQYFCNPGSEWYNAMLTAKLRIAKDIAKSLATLVTILESLIEGMYWQESLVGPSDYLQPFLKKNVVNVTGCWRQTHGNWHRVAAQMMKELMQFITTDVYTTTLTSLSQEQKQQAWGSLNLVVAEFLVFVNALKIMSAADTVNLCRVFKLAKEVGMSGEPLNYQIMPMLDAAGVNSMLTKTLQAQDPVTNIDLGVNLRVATKPCNYDLKEVFVDEVTGLSAFTLEDLDVSGQYVDSSSFEDTAVKFRLAVRTCPLSLVVKASANFVQDGGSNKFTNVACRRVQWRVNAEVHLTFQISELIAFAQAGFQKIFAGASDALSGGVESFLLDIQHLELARFEITNFPGEANIKNLVNKALEGTLREKLSELVQGKVELAMNEAIQGAMAQAGSKIPFGSERRLGTCPANAGSVAVDSARGCWGSWSLIGLLSLTRFWFF
ncbi:unnamed protein product [Durusdinium trenchii]|uniref:Uncharacterized protein n=1 Tax=Durusdinium trenchii TaxID=1381693 RepID=A0ABP0K7V9_9DINO